MNNDALPLIERTPTPSHGPLARRLAALIDGGSPLLSAATSCDHAAIVRQHQDVRSSWSSTERVAFSEHLLRDPAITDAQHPGVTRSRVRALLPDHRKVQVDTILCWLDDAQVLAPPLTLTLPFRHPRPLACTTTEELCNRLNATPHPMFNPHPPVQPVIPLVEEAPCVA